MAGDPDAIPLLVGMAIDELSMAPALIPGAKDLIRKIWVEQVADLLQIALEQDSASDVRQLVREWKSESGV
jgi:phosphoenolpyruvate-protein kinase (PTS system EI component)